MKDMIMPTNVIEGRWKDRTKKIMTAELPKNFDALKFDGYRLDLIKIETYLTHLEDIDKLIEFLQYSRAAFMALGKASPRDLSAIERYLNKEV